MSLALAGFGSYAYYMSQTQNLGYPDTPVGGQHDWIPLLCVLVFTTALALGISPISWLLIGELFPLEYRGLGSSISTSFSYFCAFVGIKLFMDFQQVSRVWYSQPVRNVPHENTISDVRFARSVLVLRRCSGVRALLRGLLRAGDERETTGRDESGVRASPVV